MQIDRAERGDAERCQWRLSLEEGYRPADGFFRRGRGKALFGTHVARACGHQANELRAAAFDSTIKRDVRRC
jgi:hypothetical protein